MRAGDRMSRTRPRPGNREDGIMTQSMQDEIGAGDAQGTDETRLLLEFLRDRDATCPACGYNLRNLTRPVCPECRETLALTVGYQKPRIGLFVAAITPSIFSGICGVIMLLPLMMIPGPPAPPLGAYLLDLFGLSSGLLGLGLFVFRQAFLRQSRVSQMAWAFVTWIIHVLAFIIVLASAN